MRIGIVAGEASGDYLGAEVIRALKLRWPHLEFEGIAGPKMQAEGARSLYPMEVLSVRGYLEVIRHLPRLLRIRRELATHFELKPPELFIGVDAPDFNLGLSRRLKKSGITTVQCVAPTVWAWRKGRLPGIKTAVNAVLAIFPFEPAIFERAGIPTRWIGHPIASELPRPPHRAAAREALKISGTDPVVALLPGSRISELKFHAELFVQTAKRLHLKFPKIRFLVPLATRQTYDLFNEAMWRTEPEGTLPITLMHGHAIQALTASDVGLVASGTATLEAALCGCPMVVTYRLSSITARMVRARKHLPFVSLPNILAQDWLVPEILQEDATPENLARALANLVSDGKTRQALEARFLELHGSLITDSPKAICDALAPWLN